MRQHVEVAVFSLQGWQAKDKVVKMSSHGWRTRQCEQAEVTLLHGQWAADNAAR